MPYKERIINLFTKYKCYDYYNCYYNWNCIKCRKFTRGHKIRCIKCNLYMRRNLVKLVNK